jgi:TonB-linked SusC/RagA family outer membrane protein
MNAHLRFMSRRILLFVFATFISIISFAQSRTVTGKVLNQKTNEPIPGVTVNVKGTDRSTSTAADGSFSILVPNRQAVLVFSSVGFGSQEMRVAESGPNTVTLTPGANNLEEVVVIGYGTTKRRDLTGSVASVKAEDIVLRPGPNPMEALQGRVAGLDITRTSGQPGAGVNIQLRGTRSFTLGANTPLFLINGLPGDYETLNPNDIESIEVLKDASSTAVYGSAGANGVIIITTKSGKAGKISIDFNTFYGYNGWSTTPKMRTGDAYLQTKRDAFKYVWDKPTKKWTRTGAQWQTDADDEKIFGPQRYALFQQRQFVDWADVFLQDNAATQNYSLGVSGGNERTKAYVSFNYTDEKGQYRGDDYKLFATTIRIDHKVKQWLSVGTNLQASYVDRDRAQDKLENALVTDPLLRPYKDDGTINPDLGNNVYNLLLDYQPGVYANVQNNTKIFVNPYIEIRPLRGLSILSRAGAHLNYLNSYRFDGIGSVNYTYQGQIPRASINQNRNQIYQWENILTYNFKVANDHDFTFTGVSSWFYNQTTNTAMSQTNIANNNFMWYNFNPLDPVNSRAGSEYNMWKTLGLMGRINYSYRGKYLFSASMRRDGASQLYETNQWNNFPAASVGWRISDEAFMAGTRGWLNNLKLRVGWGIVGIAKIEPYSSQQVMENRDMSLGGVTVPMFRSSRLITNPELGWEKSYNTNIGLDANLFKNRIDVSLDYYVTNTKGVIFTVTSPITSGNYTPGVQYQTNINVAETRNRGFEVALNSRNIIARNFEWTTTLAFGRNKEEILKLTGATANNIANGAYTLTLGEPVNSFRNYKLDGVWQIGEEADADVFGERRPGDLKVNVPGMIKVANGVFMKEVNGTPTYYYSNLSEAQKYNPALTAATNRYNYSANDYQILGANTPKWSLGVQNGFKYKSIDLTVYAYLRWGQMINYVMPGWYQPQAWLINASPPRTIPEHFNYWTPENPSNDFPVMDALSPSGAAGFSGLSYVDGSFFKIKNITLGYTLPTRASTRISIQRLRLYGTITNPLIVAKSHILKQYDPEQNGVLDYPLTRQAVVGLNVTF